MDSYTVIDNTFLNEFLPLASGDDVKVYLYGLSLCGNPNAEDNTLDTMTKVLSLSEDEVINAFSYWQELGLVQIVSTNPLEIRYLPVRLYSGSAKIRNKEKYSDFNKQIESVITGRDVTPNELNEYHTLIEIYHFEPEALVMIAKYCTQYKSNSIRYPYILAVAKDFASQGLKTVVTVEERFLEQEKASKEIKQVLNALGLKRDADIEERNLYLKWTNQFEFTQGVIVDVAKSLKRGGFAALDGLLTKYYEQQLFSIDEIQAYSKKREENFELAKVVSKNLGLSYQNYEAVVDTYISDWTNKGYDSETLTLISSYSFRQGIRTLEGMHTVIQKFYKLGLISMAAIDQYISKVLENDEKIKEILDKTGLLRNVTGVDREAYKTWTDDWGFSHESIMIVAETSIGMTNPISYMNKVLSNLRTSGTIDAESVKKQTLNIKQNNKNNKEATKMETRTYNNSELSAIFDSLSDVEI